MPDSERWSRSMAARRARAEGYTPLRRRATPARRPMRASRSSSRSSNISRERQGPAVKAECDQLTALKKGAAVAGKGKAGLRRTEPDQARDARDPAAARPGPRGERHDQRTVGEWAIVRAMSGTGGTASCSRPSTLSIQCGPHRSSSQRERDGKLSATADRRVGSARMPGTGSLRAH